MSNEPVVKDNDVLIVDNTKSELGQINTKQTLIDNVSSLPMGMVEITPEQEKILYAPVDEKLVCIRPDGLIYLPWMEYVTRLRKSFGMKWAVIPKGEPMHIGNLISWGFYLVVNGNYCGYAIGEQEWYENNKTMSITDAFEGAKSNALMRLCKGIGISLELWQPDFINSWKSKYAESCWAEKDGKKKQFWYKKGFKHLPYGWKDSSFKSNPIENNKNKSEKEVTIDDLGNGAEEHFEDATSIEGADKKNPTLLKEFAEMKKILGEKEYYRLLGLNGYEHSNMIQAEVREIVYKGMCDMADGKIPQKNIRKDIYYCPKCNKPATTEKGIAWLAKDPKNVCYKCSH